MPIKDIVGWRFERLVVKELHDTHCGYARWLCQCDCGNTTIALGTHLRQGNTKSCGCLHKERVLATSTVHGQHGSPTYVAWQNMIRRCVPGTRYYSRGIRVHSRWRKSFTQFVKDMGERPDGEYSLERVDPDGDYCPSNCEWIPKSENTIDTYRGKLTKRGKRKKMRVRSKF